jgi:hypothetical protein
MSPDEVLIVKVVVQLTEDELSAHGVLSRFLVSVIDGGQGLQHFLVQDVRGNLFDIFRAQVQQGLFADLEGISNVLSNGINIFLKSYSESHFIVEDLVSSAHHILQVRGHFESLHKLSDWFDHLSDEHFSNSWFLELSEDNIESELSLLFDKTKSLWKGLSLKESRQNPIHLLANWRSCKVVPHLGDLLELEHISEALSL